MTIVTCQQVSARQASQANLCSYTRTRALCGARGPRCRAPCAMYDANGQMTLGVPIRSAGASSAEQGRGGSPARVDPLEALDADASPSGGVFVLIDTVALVAIYEMRQLLCWRLVDVGVGE